MTLREKAIVAGIYLSKYDKAGLDRLGFAGFTEAFNVIGYALGSRPASINNYRDEFDPMFPNPRKGWHKRPMRHYCREVFEKYKDLDFESFTGLIASFVGYDENIESEVVAAETGVESDSAFARRLITGLAAERYFEAVYLDLPEFGGFAMENTTQFGCGYDFRFTMGPGRDDFLAVEVKGLRDTTGCLSMTPKEYETADALRGRFFLFVVKNFRQTPFHQTFQDPLSGALDFRKAERIVRQVSWLTDV
jgi:hypothetical protein